MDQPEQFRAEEAPTPADVLDHVIVAHHIAVHEAAQADRPEDPIDRFERAILSVPKERFDGGYSLKVDQYLDSYSPLADLSLILARSPRCFMGQAVVALPQEALERIRFNEVLGDSRPVVAKEYGVPYHLVSHIYLGVQDMRFAVACDFARAVLRAYREGQPLPSAACYPSDAHGYYPLAERVRYVFGDDETVEALNVDGMEHPYAYSREQQTRAEVRALYPFGVSGVPRSAL